METETWQNWEIEFSTNDQSNSVFLLNENIQMILLRAAGRKFSQIVLLQIVMLLFQQWTLRFDQMTAGN